MADMRPGSFDGFAPLGSSRQNNNLRIINDLSRVLKGLTEGESVMVLGRKRQWI